MTGLAIPAAAILLCMGQAPGAQPSTSEPAWPRNEGRLFSTPSREAWKRVQEQLKELGLSAEKTDRRNQLLLTKWVSFVKGRFEWLPRPTLPEHYAAERVRFEVFVSPFVEPARLYVGSVTELRQMKVRVSTAIMYNNRRLNQALLAELAKALGHEGFPMPSSREERDELTASILKGQANDCAQRVDSCRGSTMQLEEPRKIALSEFQVHYPQGAVEERVQAPVVLELDVGEDGAVLGGRLKGSPRGHQLEASAAGATSLLVYSPLRLCGCPTPHVSVYTVNYRIEHR